MKVLLTGHHGYIGSIVAPVLQAAGLEVTGLDTLYYEGCDLDGAEQPAVEALRIDIRDVTADDVRGFDAVAHFAALSNDPLADLSPDLTTEINFRATVRLAEAAKAAGVPRFVFSSSCSMYGASDSTAGVDESAPLQPLSAYAESKVRSEEALSELTDDDFAPVFLRNATAYGVSPRLRVDLVLNNLVGWAFTTGKVKILSDGTPWRPIVHIEDIARATLAALEAPAELVRGEAFNVGASNENYQVSELAEIVRETVPDCEVEYAGSGDPDPRSYRVDFSKFARTFPDIELGWTARAGAQELYDAYRAVGLTLEEFESNRYIRLRHLKLLLDEGRLAPDLRWRDLDARVASR
ncbi:MAG: SDR family oxidoreductase [Actinomycetota bacterium]|nr:SDR family oxidoreductase [Actinomycetota bacterium]